jgi:hypothetical protein
MFTVGSAAIGLQSKKKNQFNQGFECELPTATVPLSSTKKGMDFPKKVV